MNNLFDISSYFNIYGYIWVDFCLIFCGEILKTKLLSAHEQKVEIRISDNFGTFQKIKKIFVKFSENFKALRWQQQWAQRNL